MGTATDRLANAAVVAGAALYASLLAFAIMSTAGDAFLQGFMVDQTPANFVFVALTQVVGCAWLLAGTLRVFELSRGRVMARALLGHASRERAPITARDVAVLASIGTKTIVGYIGLYSALCWDESRDGIGSEKTCVGVVGNLFDGSPCRHRVLRVCQRHVAAGAAVAAAGGRRPAWVPQGAVGVRRIRLLFPRVWTVHADQELYAADIAPEQRPRYPRTPPGTRRGDDD
jgi:hypothetical protein